MKLSDNICPRYQYAVDILSKRWTPLILKSLVSRAMRFNELADEIEVISDRVLSERLKELEAEGILERRVYPETPVRVEYSLTEKGRDLTPLLDAIEDWSHKWISLEQALAAGSNIE